MTEIQKVNKPVLKLYYNDRGHRVKKESFLADGITIGKTTHYVRDVAGSVMAIYTDNILGEQPIYGNSRLGVAFNGSNNSKSYVYELTDYLGNVRATFSDSGATESASDYYPGGMAMPNRNIVGDYRYAYQGQELDQETGKVAFQLRLYDQRIMRWLTPDPYGQFDSPYLAMGNNWMNGTDPDGGCWDSDGNEIPCATIHLDEVVVSAPRINNSWNTEGMYWNTTFQGNLNDWNALNNTNFTDPRDAFDWYKQQEWNAIESQHRAEFYAAREAYGRGVLQLMSVLTLPVSIAELGTAGAIALTSGRTAFTFADDAALLSDDIVNYSITTQARAPKGGLIRVNSNSSLSSFNGGQFIGGQTTLNFGRQTQNFSSLPFGASTLRPAVHATLATPALNGSSGVGLSSLVIYRQIHQK